MGQKPKPTKQTHHCRRRIITTIWKCYFGKMDPNLCHGGSGHISDAEADPDTPCDSLCSLETPIPLGWGTNGVPQDPWTEQTSNNPPTTGGLFNLPDQFILKPGAVNNITVGGAGARASGGDPFAFG